MRVSTMVLRLLLSFMLGLSGTTFAQGETTTTPPAAAPTDDQPTNQTESKSSPPTTTTKLKEVAGKLATDAEAEAAKIAKEVDKIPEAKKAAAGILQPIYAVAEALAFPAFHWLAFALMAAGVFSFALQLVLGKLIVLMRLGFSLKEIASDAVGFSISIVGLVLTTQAATENSTFTQSPTAVISATAVGAVLGIILYRWGQSQELEAAAGRSRRATPPKK